VSTRLLHNTGACVNQHLPTEFRHGSPSTSLHRAAPLTIAVQLAQGTYPSRFGYVFEPYIKERDMQVQIMLSFFAFACRRRFCPLTYTALKCCSFTYDHRILRIRLPVRSAIYKQDTGGLVVRWVTTSESPLLYVFGHLFAVRMNNTSLFAKLRKKQSMGINS
jgi:hypothetical protein